MASVVPFDQVVSPYGLAHFMSIRLIVALAVCSFCIYKYNASVKRYRADIEFGIRNGCKPPAFVLKDTWPLAFDMMKRGLKAGRQKKLLGLMGYYVEELGPTAQLTVLGHTRFVTKDPENIEAILSSQFDDFHLGSRNQAMKTMVGEGIFTQDGPAWKHSRELLRRQFIRMQYQNLECFKEHIESLIQTLKCTPGIVDLQPLFYRLTLDATIAVILGQSHESFKDKIDLFSRSFNKASFVSAYRARLGDLYWMYAPRGFFKACRTVKSYIDQFVRDALQQGDVKSSDRCTFINDLYKEHHFHTRPVRDQVLNVLIAGRDTTAATMSYVFRLLLRYPRVLTKLQSEIDSNLGQDREVTRACIQRMPYLQNVLKETLRLYPPVPLNIRYSKHATTLPRGGGPDGRSPILVRAGMPVAYSVYHMQRREDLYGPDAGTFRPERWEGPELSDIKWGYLPFNGGPRLCLGKDFGLMFASYAVVRVVQSFPDIRLPPGEKWEEPGEERQDLTLTLSNADGCKVLLK